MKIGFNKRNRFRLENLRSKFGRRNLFQKKEFFITDTMKLKHKPIGEMG
jgi:hypothetical protein